MIEFQNVYKSYKNKTVLKDITLEIHSGEFFVLVGSSGCGKTTLLKTINKLNSVTRGKVIVEGEDVKKSSETVLPKQIGYVVQENGLFPHLTVEENIRLIMKLAGIPRSEHAARVEEMLQLVHLDPDSYRDQFPSQLSGGQCQRVNIARALATNPPILLMDEPFSALDPITRTELQDELYQIHQKFNRTIVFVTHDMNEAIKLADRICILESGSIRQCDTPEQILKHPANAYVEGFVGKSKLWSNPDMVKAEDIMLLKPVCAPKQYKVRQALYTMSHHNVDSLLIVDEHKLLGIVWLQDLKGIAEAGEPILNYLSDQYVSVLVDTSLQKIIETIDYNISGIIPVIDHDSCIKGFLTKGRLLSILSRQFTPDGSADERSGIIE